MNNWKVLSNVQHRNKAEKIENDTLNSMEKHILLFPHNNYISARLVAYNKSIIEYNITCNPDRMFFYYKKQVGIQLKITASTKSLKSFFCRILNTFVWKPAVIRRPEIIFFSSSLETRN